VASYAERIQGNNKNYILDKVFLYEIHHFKGIACIRSKNIVEASKCFSRTEELKH